MRYWTVALALAVFLAETAGGVWLNNQQRRVAERESELQSAITAAIAQEKQLRDREADVEQRGRALTDRDKDLTDRDKHLASREQALDARTEVVGQREELAQRRDDVLKFAQNSGKRLREAIASREVRLSETAHLDHVVSDLHGRVELVQKSEPTEEWAIRAREQALKDLITAREERALWGSAEAYGYEATVNYEIESLTELAHRLELPDSVIPSNDFELLDRQVLEDLELRWTAKAQELRKRNAAAPGCFEQTLTAASERIQAIRNAKGKPQAVPYDHLAARVLRSEASNEVGNWLAAHQDGARSAKIGQREAHLLKLALARDRTNFPAFVRMLELEHPQVDSDRGIGILEARQMLVLSRAAGFAPGSTATTEVVELLRKRFADPLAAVQCEAKLRRQWMDNQMDSANDFERWMVKHLTDSQLYEVKVFLDASRDRLRLISQQVPQNLQEHVKVDIATTDKEYAALQAEITQRDTKSGPSINPENLSSTMPLNQLVPGALTLLSDPSLRQPYWESLRGYLSRTGPNAEAERIQTDLELAGFEDQVTQLERNVEKLRELERSCTKYGKSANDLKAFQTAKQSLGESRGLIENGLKKISMKTTDPARIADLHARIERSLAIVPPPPDATTAGLAYGDPRFFEFTAIINENLASLSGDVSKFESDSRERERERELVAEKKAEAARLESMLRELGRYGERSGLSPSGSGSLKTDWDKFNPRDPSSYDQLNRGRSYEPPKYEYKPPKYEYKPPKYEYRPPTYRPPPIRPRP